VPNNTRSLYRVVSYLPLLFSGGLIPDFNNAVSATRSQVFQTLGILCQTVHAIYVAGLEVAQEGLREHSFHLGSGQGPCVFARAFERMLCSKAY
jgi:hypothetical protein